MRLLRNGFSDIRSTKKCVQCGESHPACLDFHHRDPSTKIKAVAQMVAGAYSPANITKEIEKCDVLCSNCHRKLHWKERRVA